MTPDELLKHYVTKYRFHKETGISPGSLRNWINWGYVPECAQYKIESITNGLFKTEWKKKNE